VHVKKTPTEKVKEYDFGVQNREVKGVKGTWIFMSKGVPYARAFTIFMSCPFILSINSKGVKPIQTSKCYRSSKQGIPKKAQ